MVGYWHGYLSGARCSLAYGPADTTALPLTVSWFYLSGTSSLHVTCCRQIKPLPFNPLHRRSLSCLFLPPTPVPLSYSGLRSSYDYELIQLHTSSNSVGNYGRDRAQPQAYFSAVNRRSSCLLRYAETVCGLFRGSGGCGVGVCNDSDSDDPADDLLVSVDSLTGRVEADAVPSEVLELTTLDKFFCRQSNEGL